MRCSPPGFVAVTLQIGALIGGCSGNPTEPTNALTFRFDFSRGSDGDLLHPGGRHLHADVTPRRYGRGDRQRPW